MKTTVIYLLHFSKPYKHAKHYLGSTSNLSQRIEHHRGKFCDVRLLRIVKENGGELILARTWRGDKKLERKMKGRGLAPLCPLCGGSRAGASLTHVRG